MRVGRFEADLFEVRNFSIRIIFGALNAVKHGGVLCAKGWHENTLKTKKKISCYNRVAVGPACIIS